MIRFFDVQRGGFGTTVVHSPNPYSGRAKKLGNVLEFAMRNRTLTALVFVFVATASLTRAATPAPDLILFNGKIFTGAPGAPYVHALEIQDERIAAVGDSEQIRKLAGPMIRQIDLGGRTVIPGLNDAHNHMHVSPPDTVDLQFQSLNPTWAEVKEAISAQV